MRRASLILSVAVCSGIACDSPTEPKRTPIETPILLTDAVATGFDDALRDVSLRVLPTLRTIDPSDALTPATEALITAITTRNRGALRVAIGRTERALSDLERQDHAGTLANDLDAIRLILAQASPLADEPAVAPLR